MLMVNRVFTQSPATPWKTFHRLEWFKKGAHVSREAEAAQAT